MSKILTNEKIRFFVKITVAHIIAYVIITILAMPLTFSYAESMMELMGFRPLDEINMGVVLFGQVVRGLLFGVVVWLVRDSVIGTKLAWLKLWVILIILGIFNTYGPAHGSIQGMIYLAPIEDIPVSASLGMLETLAQPLLFSIIVTYRKKKNKLDAAAGEIIQ